MDKPEFFSLSLKQPVNQWLGIGLLVAMCSWVVVYYLVNSSQIISNKFVNIAATTKSRNSAD